MKLSSKWLERLVVVTSLLLGLGLVADVWFAAVVKRPAVVVQKQYHGPDLPLGGTMVDRYGEVVATAETLSLDERLYVELQYPGVWRSPLVIPPERGLVLLDRATWQSLRRGDKVLTWHREGWLWRGFDRLQRL